MAEGVGGGEAALEGEDGVGGEVEVDGSVVEDGAAAEEGPETTTYFMVGDNNLHQSALQRLMPYR